MVSRLVQTIVGFALALLVVGGFLAAVGPRAVFASMSDVVLPVYAVGFAAVVGAFYCWSEALRRLLVSVGGDVRGPRYRAAFMSGEFVKQVVPMGHSGGPVFVSYAVSRETDASYEATFAAATLVEFVNIGASVVLALAGLGVLLATGSVETGAVFVALLVGLAVAVAALLGAAVFVTSRRAFVERVAVVLATVVRGSLGRLSGRVRSAFDPERVAGVAVTYYAALDRALDDRRQVVRAAAFSLVGWALFLAPLYTSFRAIGAPVPYAVVVFVVPVLSLVNVVPLPGGLGGFEIALAAVLVALVGLDLPTATAGVFLYRLSNYWFVVLMGGIAAGAFSIRLTEPPPVLDPGGPEPDEPAAE